MYVLGIDGGGTKTTGVISDKGGNIYARQTVGATNPNSIDQSIIEAEFTTLFRLLAEENQQAFDQLQAIYVGMAGVDRAEDQEKMRGLLIRVIDSFYPSQKPHQLPLLKVDNDAINALYSGTLGQPGIVNIAGTGSIAFGINEKGERDRVGGWGYLLGDPGSGYAIGRAALQHVFQVHDGFCSTTLLYELVLKETQVTAAPQLLSKIYEIGKARQIMAPLSRIVVEAADQGDQAAQDILTNAARDMSKAIYCLIAKLFKQADKTLIGEAQGKHAIPVILTGGVYQRADWLLPTLEAELAQKCAVKLIVPKVQPVAGALVAAWHSVDQPLTADYLEALYNNGLAN